MKKFVLGFFLVISLIGSALTIGARADTISPPPPPPINGGGGSGGG